MTNDFPNQLRTLREAKGWTQAELARRCGDWHASLISQYEGGSRSPGIDNLVKLCADKLVFGLHKLYPKVCPMCEGHGIIWRSR